MVLNLDETKELEILKHEHKIEFLKQELAAKEAEAKMQRDIISMQHEKDLEYFRITNSEKNKTLATEARNRMDELNKQFKTALVNAGLYDSKKDGDRE